MPNWWLQWAERIALVLAERWLQSSSNVRREGPEGRHADSDPGAPTPGPAPAPDVTTPR